MNRLGMSVLTGESFSSKSRAFVHRWTFVSAALLAGVACADLVDPPSPLTRAAAEDQLFPGACDGSISVARPDERPLETCAVVPTWRSSHRQSKFDLLIRLGEVRFTSQTVTRP